MTSNEALVIASQTAPLFAVIAWSNTKFGDRQAVRLTEKLTIREDRLRNLEKFPSSIPRPSNMSTKLRILVPIKRVLDYAIKPRIKKDQSGIDLSTPFRCIQR